MRLRLPWWRSARHAGVNDLQEPFLATEPADTRRGDDQGTLAHAWELFESGRYWEAHRFFLRLFDAGFRAPSFARKLGWSHLAVGDLLRAEACMREAVVVDPDDWQSLFGLGEVLRPRDPTAAKSAFARALSLSPDNLQCVLSTCACDLALKDSAAAEAAARRALDLSTGSASAWINFGAALLLQARFSEAGEAFA
jgi:tetratricopeptide (TPR) repeat protein